MKRWVLVSLGVLPVMAFAQAGNETDTIESTKLVFQEQDQGLKPYKTRTLINDDYLRSDGGGNGGTYVLFDREARTIYSVSPADKTILVIPPQKVDREPPMALELARTQKALPDAPKVGGKQAAHFKYTVNDKTCRNVVAVEGMLEGAVSAMQDFRRVLAGEQSKNMDRTPPEMRKACQLANDIFAPVRHLENGFPIRQWDYRGHSRALVDYEEGFEADRKLFRLPEGYHQYTTDDLTGGQS